MQNRAALSSFESAAGVVTADDFMMLPTLRLRIQRPPTTFGMQLVLAIIKNWSLYRCAILKIGAPGISSII